MKRLSYFIVGSIILSVTLFVCPASAVTQRELKILELLQTTMELSKAQSEATKRMCNFFLKDSHPITETETVEHWCELNNKITAKIELMIKELNRVILLIENEK